MLEPIDLYSNGMIINATLNFGLKISQTSNKLMKFKFKISISHFKFSFQNLGPRKFIYKEIFCEIYPKM